MNYSLKLPVPARKRIKQLLQNTKKTPKQKTLSSDSSRNTYLVETEFNSDIDEEVRESIEQRFNLSSVNPCYKFPRTSHKFPSITNRQQFSVPPFPVVKIDPVRINMRSRLKNLCLIKKCYINANSTLVSRLRNNVKTPSPIRKHIKVNAVTSVTPTKMYKIKKK